MAGDSLRASAPAAAPSEGTTLSPSPRFLAPVLSLPGAAVLPVQQLPRRGRLPASVGSLWRARNARSGSAQRQRERLLQRAARLVGSVDAGAEILGEGRRELAALFSLLHSDLQGQPRQQAAQQRAAIEAALKECDRAFSQARRELLALLGEGPARKAGA